MAVAQFSSVARRSAPVIDQTKKRALIEYIREREIIDAREILLSPDRYFDGYDDRQCSICANVRPFSTAHFAARLREIRSVPISIPSSFASMTTTMLWSLTIAGSAVIRCT
jgi:hypothetical protein